jgi:hypothetical protein
LGGSVYNIKKNTEALVLPSKENRLEVNTDKTMYLVVSWDQNVGRSHNIKNDNTSFEKAEEFKYLEKPLKNQNSIQ